MQQHAYLFQVRSIQKYLFRTGKLKDVIAASERLDMLVDDNEHSTLYQVLDVAGLQSDLTKPQQGDAVIHFTRCKGGAFYAFCQHQVPLVTLRSLWTLTIGQMFPNLQFTDALTQGESVKEAMALGHRRLLEDRQNSQINLPLSSAITARTQRTGAAKVSLTIGDKSESGIDLDTDFHRQAYNSLSMRSTAALQNKFTPEALRGDVHYPINLENDFQFSAPDAKAPNKEAIKDLAIIHIDGNGLGILLRGLKEALQNKSDDDFCHVMREFSKALATATANAAQLATQWLYDVGAYQHKAEGDKEKRTYLPMRPLVMGGDDVTLLCRADLALDYAKRFCIEFKQQSLLALDDIYCNHLNNTEIKRYLTASGGVLFHKAGHPFTYSHNLVEDLTKTAKQLTKKIDVNVGPAALAFFRLSTAVSADFAVLAQRFQQFTVQDKHGRSEIQLGRNVYLVQSNETGEASFDDLDQCIALANNELMPMSKWRQMGSHLALGNKTEADRIYERAVERCTDNNQEHKLAQAFKGLANITEDSHFHQWYWTTPQGQLQTVIADMLIIERFTPVINTQTREDS
jgi:hypothetical protein